MGIAVFVSGATVAGTTTLQTLTVDDDGGADYDTIQQAVREAAPGDTIEVRPGTYREEVLIDKTITVVAPDGATLNGSTLEGDPVGITIEEAAAPTVSGLTVTGYHMGVDARGSGVDNPASSGDWTLRNLTVQNAIVNGAVDASGSTGDWTIADSTLVDELAVDVADATGNWTIVDSTLTGRVFAYNTNGRWTIEGSVVNDSDGEGIVTRESDSAWTIRNTTVRDVRLDGVSARSSSGAWTIRNATILNASQDGVSAYGTSGDWTIRDTVVRNSTEDGVNVGTASADWTILNTTIRDNGATGVTAARTSGSWEVHESAIFDNRLGLDAFEADPAGDATRNWWGACDGPGGDFDGSGASASGNVTVAPFYTDAARTTLNNETDSPCGPAPFDFGVELEQSETVTRGGTVEISASVINNADVAVSSTTVELLVDTDDDGQFESGEVVAGRTVDFEPLEFREMVLEYAGVQLAAGTTYRYMVRIRKDGRTNRSSTNGTLTVEESGVTISYAPTRPEPGATVDFVASIDDSDRSIQGYVWEIDGEPAGDGPETTWTFDTAGEHEVSLTVTDDDDTSDTARATVTVEAANRPPVARIDANRTIVASGDAVRFDATNSSDPDGSVASYAWDLDGDGTPDVDGPTLVQSFWTPNRWVGDQRTVRLRVSDGTAVDWTRMTVTVFEPVNQPPAVNFSISPSKPVAGDTVRFDAVANDSDGSIVSYEWDFLDDGAVDDTGATTTKTYPSPTFRPETVRLTVTDNDGATATVTRDVSIQAQSYYRENQPPNASFSVSPAKPEPGEAATLDAGMSSDPDDSDDLLTYEWYVDGTQINGAGPTPDSAFHRFGSAGDHNVTLLVSDGAKTNSLSRTITVGIRNVSPTANFTYDHAGGTDPSPGVVRPGERLRFDAGSSERVSGRLIEAYLWGFGDGGSANGRSAMHAYPRSGTYTVGLLIRDDAGALDFVERTITVREEGDIPTVADITQDPEGLPLAGVDLDITYSVDVKAADSVETVEFERGGQTYVDSDGSDGWTHTLNPKDLSGDQRMTVTVTDDEGDTATETVTVEVNEPPAWVERLLFKDSTATTTSPWPELRRNVEVRTNGQGETVVEFNFSLVPIDFQQSISAGIEFGAVGYNLDAGGRMVYNMETAMAHAEGGYEGGGSVAKTLVKGGASAEVEASGLVDARTWAIKRAMMRGKGGISAGVGFTPPVKFGPEFDGSVEVGFGITQKWDERNGILQNVDGQVRPEFGGRAHAGLWLTKWIYFGGTADLTLVSYFPLPSSNTGYGMEADLFVRGEYKAFSWSSSLRAPYHTEIGNTAPLSPAALRPAEIERSGWELEEKHVGRPPGGNVTAAGMLGADAAPQAVVGSDRLTRDTVADESPAVAYDGNYTAVWVRQDPAKNVTDGYDVYTSTSTDGDTWGQPTKVTDDRTAEVRPSVAASNDSLLAAWTRVNASLDGMDGPGDALPETETTYAVRGSDGWAAPVTLTDDGAVDLEPAVAGTDDRFLVAWVSDPDDINTTVDQRVRYAVVDVNGGFDAVRTIPNATDVAVAADDGSGFTLAYLRSDDGRNGSVVHATVATDGSRTERARHPARGVAGLAATGDRLAWITDDGFRYLDEGAPETVPLGNATGATDLDLVFDGDTPIAIYRVTPPGPVTPQVVYQRRTADGWLAPRPLTGGTAPGLSALQASTVAGPGELVSVAAARNVSQEGNNDLFAVRQRFAPDLAVAVSTGADRRTTAAGEQVRVNYTVRNVGDRPVTNRVAVTLENESGAVATEPLAPLDSGKRVSGSFTTSVDPGGTTTVHVDPADDVAELNESNNRATLAVARPDLAVGTVTERRQGEDLIVSVDVENRGPVAVANTTVELRSGGIPVANRTVAVRADGLRTILLRVPAGVVNRSLADAVVVDPDDSIAEREESNNARYDRFLGVDLAVSTAGTSPAPNGTLADVFISNADTGNATAAVTLDAGGQALTYDLRIDGAPAQTARVFERARLYHPTTDGTVTVSAAPTDVRDAIPRDNGARTTVASDGTELTPLVATDVTATLADGTATLDVTLANDAGVATGAPLTVAFNGSTANATTAIVAPNSTGTATLTAPTAPGTYEVTVTTPGSTLTRTLTLAGTPDVTGDGRPATSIDDDPLLEDVDGDGEFSIGDVQIFFQNRDADVVQNNAEFFNFDGQEPPGVSIGDVQALFQLFQEHG